MIFGGPESTALQAERKMLREHRDAAQKAAFETRDKLIEELTRNFLADVRRRPPHPPSGR